MANAFLRQKFWSVNRAFFKHAMKKQFNYEYSADSDPIPDSSFILVSNHANFFDPWIVAHPSPKAVSIMINEEGFKAKGITRWYLEKIGGFPKKKGGTDVKAMKTSLKRLKAGSPLMIFPEGQTSWDGETQPIYPGIEKLIIRSKLPLVMINLTGHFISRPWWSSNDRKGKVIITRKVVTPETLGSTKPDDLRDMIVTHLKNNDCKNPLLKNVEFKSDAPAQGINRLLWCCPSCDEERELSFTDTSVSCSSCNETFTINPNLTVTPHKNGVEDVYDWVAIQKKITKARISNNAPTDLLIEKDGIRLVDVDYSGRIITLDTGKLSLTGEILTYHGEHGTLNFPIAEMTQPVFQQKDMINFDTSDGSNIRFFIEGDALFKWLMYLRYLTDYATAEEQGYY